MDGLQYYIQEFFHVLLPTFQILGQREISPVATSLIFSLEAVFAAICGWLVLDECLSVKEVSGCILIFTAVVKAQSPKLWTRLFHNEKHDFMRF